MPADIERAVDRAILRRLQYASAWRTDAFRLFHGWSEGCPGIEVDQWGSVLTVDGRDQSATEAQAVAAHLRDSLAPRAIVLRIRKREPELFHGALDESVIVHEDGLRFWVEPMRPGNPGLYTDARAARAWLRANCADRRILNLFAFTGSLGLAAARGGAKSVVHVDSQKGSLRRLRRNYELNEIGIDDRDMVRLNIYQHLRKKAARRQRYDGIIIDAPPYRPLKDRTPGERSLFSLAHHASEMLAPGGWMLCFFHHMREPQDELEARVAAACSLPLEVVWRGQSGEDFPEDADIHKSRMAALQRAD